MTHDYNIAFAGGPFDHAETRRDVATLQTYLKNKNATAILMTDGKPAIAPDGALFRVHPSAMKGRNIFDPGPVFLGMDSKKPLFAFNVKVDIQSPARPGEAFENLRGIAGRLSAKDLAIAGRAKSLFDWHKTHSFCAQCGKKTMAYEGGVKRICPECQQEHFPRVNPVVIMLVEHGDQVLLGRGATWPEGAYSALAGFVSPGETMEEAVRREVWEETGVNISDARYVMSQPWPFPSQIMVGMTCRAENKKLTINTKEIETARWFDRKTVRAVFDKTSEEFLIPPRYAIAHQLLRWWLDQDG
ncbi:NAD(+) diphosphatase [Robiginitomaculum antarcticum]|uniref:NAD(+) diphosphatase n=1 Tax=Robiginitomaculum antarcticum TaxID=437507 RepID=UPI00035F29BF|nr:NAD(+) diphosphatase [Robiginitomaculum antarcticum]